MSDPSAGLRAALLAHARRCPGQAALAAAFLQLLDDARDPFLRDRLEGHFTGSAWLVSADGRRVVLMHHRKLGRWLQPGGHADGDRDLAAVALPLDVLGELVSMGTLLAFATVCLCVLVLRRTRPDLPRPFRVPAVWLISLLGAGFCLYLFAKAFAEHWMVFVGWTILGQLIYFGYGMRHSRLNRR